MTENLDYLEELIVLGPVIIYRLEGVGGGGWRMFGFRWNGGGISRCQQG